MRDSIVQEYIEMRNSKRFDIGVFWRMYQSEGGKLQNPQEFMNHFLHEIQYLEGMEIRATRDRDAILSGIDTKLGLSILYDKNGQFLKIIN